MKHKHELQPKIEPTSSKILPLMNKKPRIQRDSSLVKIPQPNNPENTFINPYSSLIHKDSSEKLPSQHPKHSLSLLPSQTRLASNNQHIQRAISSINNYNESLKSTVSRKYKGKRRQSQSLLREKQEWMSQKRLIQECENSPDTIALKNPLMTKYSNKSNAFKTINLLYQAIVDSTLHRKRKKKEDFQLAANRLPIIDRFNITKRLSVFKQPPSLQKSPQKVKNLQPLTQKQVKMVTLYQPKLSMRSQAKKEPPAGMVASYLREDIDIIPWSIDEQSPE